MILEYFQMAWTNLTHRKVRTYLTIIGIFIGISAVVSLVSLGNGLNMAIEEQMSKVGGDKLIISPKSAFQGLPGAASLAEDDMKVISKVNGVMETTPERFRTAAISHDRDQIFYYVVGLPEDNSQDLLIETAGVEIIEGRMLKKGEKFKAVIASDYAKKKIFSRTIHAGDKITINENSFEVVGVAKTDDAESGIDLMVFINQNAYESIFDNSDRIEMILAKVDSADNVEKISNDIERALRNYRNLKEGEEDFEVQTPLQLVATFATIFNIVQAVIIGIAAISLIVGAVGIANTMYTSVVERTKDIGIMKSIGATNEQIRNLFLVESGMLGLAGGIVGVLVGIGIGKGIQYGGAAALGTTLIRAEFPLMLIAGAMLFAFLLGAFSGMFPALQAAKLKPVDALRFK